MIAEMLEIIAGGTIFLPASMRPRSDDRGNDVGRGAPGRGGRASMRLRSDDRGNHVLSAKGGTDRAMRLQ